MATAGKNTPGKQVMDVSKPGKSAADATTRPIIVGHKPLVQDPMVTTAEDINPEATPEVTEQEEAVASPATTRKVIAPITPVEPEEEADKPEETPVETETEPEVESSDAAVVDAVVDQMGSKRKNDQLSEEEKKKQAALDKLVEEKKYFIPIGKSRHKRRTRWAGYAAGLAVLLAGGTLLAADARVINLGFEPPINFFKDVPETSIPLPQEASVPSSTKPPLVRIATSVSQTVKLYSDTAKLYSLEYPDNWVLTESPTFGEGTATDPSVSSVPITIVYPNALDKSGVAIQADATGNLKAEITKYWQDNKHTPKPLTINGYQAQYVQKNFNAEAESYTDEEYLITDGNAAVFMTFRKNYYHQWPAENWDASNAIPGFDKIRNSIKLL